MVESPDKRLLREIINEIIETKLKEEALEAKTTRLDLKSRICLMGAVILGTSDQDSMTVEKAVDIAVQIENEADAKVKKMKTFNPIPRTKRFAIPLKKE